MSNLLREEALAIWRAGVDAVRSDQLVRQHVSVRDRHLIIGPDEWPLDQIGKICVVGAGKAGAGMAAGLEQALGESVIRSHQLSGWVNVPEDCVRPLRAIHLHAARPAGVNEPTRQGQAGAEEILRRVAGLHPQDLCLCLLSGGGSALLPAPQPGISLEEKLQITRYLSAAGASIQELNAVRRQLSRIKGGGLARACRAGQIVVLMISDVIGDPLDVIASGPTVEPSNPTDAAKLAITVARKYDLSHAGVGDHVLQHIERPAAAAASATKTANVHHLVIGNNRVACEAAAAEARRRGYETRIEPPESAETTAESMGQQLAETLRKLSHSPTPQCVVCGGEPVVRLSAPPDRGLGGRNQQLALAALQHLLHQNPAFLAKSAEGLRPRPPESRTEQNAKPSKHTPEPHRTSPHDELSNPLRNGALLSGGTDGEDGPTDAAGAVIDAQLAADTRDQALDPAPYLLRNDAYHFFAATDGLICTGPTHTNVCDLRVVLRVGQTSRLPQKKPNLPELLPQAPPRQS